MGSNSNSAHHQTQNTAHSRLTRMNDSTQSDGISLLVLSKKSWSSRVFSVPRERTPTTSFRDCCVCLPPASLRQPQTAPPSQRCCVKPADTSSSFPRLSFVDRCHAQTPVTNRISKRSSSPPPIGGTLVSDEPPSIHSTNLTIHGLMITKLSFPCQWCLPLAKP